MQDFGKFKRIIIRFWPLLFILGVWFIFSSPYFIRGRVPYASTYQVNFFPPWSHYEKFWGPVKNNAMPDIHTQIYPWKKLTSETYKSGQIPLWNPYNFAGNPHLANFQSAVLSPFNLLFLVLPFIDAWSILVLLQPLLAGLFMYLLMRFLKVSKTGSLISSMAFMFCGFIVVWMTYGTMAYAILYLPLALFAIGKYHQTNKLRFLILLTLTIPLSFFSGHFQISIYFLAALVSYILFKGFTTKNVLATCCLLLVTIIGLLLSSLQILPSIQLYLHSVRSELFLLSEVIPFSYLITVIAPDFFGNPVTRNDWFGHYAEWAGFIGIWPLLFAIYAIFKRKTILFFATLGIGALALSVNSPISTFIVSLKIPVISTSALSRIIVLFSFAFAILAGFGFDQLRKDLRSKRTGKTLTNLLLIMTLFLVAVWLLVLIGKVYPDEWLIVAKRNFILPTVLFIGGVFFIALSKIDKKFIILVTCYLLLVTSFDSLRFAQKWMPFDPKELVYPEVPVISAIREHIGNGRIFATNFAEATVSSYYGFPSIEGYDPLYIGRYGEFIQSAGNGNFTKSERSVVHLTKHSLLTDRVLDFLGVTLIFHPVRDTKASWAYPVWEKENRYELAYKDDKFKLYRNTMAMERAVLFYDYEVIKNKEGIIKRFYSEDFDFRKKLILEEKIGIEFKEGSGSAKIIKYSPNQVTISVLTDEPALLFIADNYYPGWKAKINNVETKIYRANYTFRAVAVPEGRSEVQFIYGDFPLVR